ncbi:15344_t:CDS:2, partial [Racocetra fulgida]
MSTDVSALINPPEIINQKVFPDQSEDVFWQKASDANEETRDPQQEHCNFVITPPPPLPSANIMSRHSRKSSRISWGLQTDFERHIGLLESKLTEIVSQGNKHVDKSVGFEVIIITKLQGTPLSTLGYHPGEYLSPDINFENEDDEQLHATHNPQESDEGLWLLWKSSSITSKNNSASNQWNLPILTRNRNMNAVTTELSNGEYEMHHDDENDSVLDEMLLNNGRRKSEDYYLRMNGAF